MPFFPPILAASGFHLFMCSIKNHEQAVETPLSCEIQSAFIFVKVLFLRGKNGIDVLKRTIMKF